MKTMVIRFQDQELPRILSSLNQLSGNPEIEFLEFDQLEEEKRRIDTARKQIKEGNYLTNQELKKSLAEP